MNVQGSWIPKTLAEIRKAVAAAAGVAAVIVANGLLSGTAQRWTTAGLGVATFLGVYVVPNAAPAGAAGA